MLGTIKIPRNLSLLTERLPKAQYDSVKEKKLDDDLFDARLPSRLENATDDTKKGIEKSSIKKPPLRPPSSHPNREISNKNDIESELNI